MLDRKESISQTINFSVCIWNHVYTLSYFVIFMHKKEINLFWTSQNFDHDSLKYFLFHIHSEFFKEFLSIPISLKRFKYCKEA